MIETYIPLYRKYRPQTFADLIGQEAISQTLGNAIKLNRVAHAYLFCGPRGTGKTSSARIFAKSLNCEHGPTVTPCLQCESCRGIAQGTALDVVEFDAASNTGVDKARELIENVQYTAMAGRFKIYIIDEVHMLTNQAFNALLKTLEEPPPNVIFIFATTEAHKVLPTIISRCQRFDFNRITTEDIIGRLRHIAQVESISIDEEALLMIGRHARGGLRDAVGLLDQVSVLGRAQQDKVIGRKDVALFIGALEEDILVKLGATIAERRAADLITELNELINRGIEPIQLIKDLTVHFRNLLLVQAVGGNANPELLALPPDYFGQLAEQARLFPEPEEIPQIIARFSFIERNVRNSNQPQLWLEVGLIELAYRHEINLVKDLSDRLAGLEARLSNSGPLPVGATPGFPSAPAGYSGGRTALDLGQSPSAPASRPGEPSTRPALGPGEPSAVPAIQPASLGSSSPMTSQKAFSSQAAATGSQGGTAFPQSNVTGGNPGVIGGTTGSLQASFNQVIPLIPSLATRALLQQQAFPIRMEDDHLLIGCASEPTLNLLKKPDKFIHLQKAVNKYFGREIRVEVVFEKKPAGQPAMAAAPQTEATIPPLFQQAVASPSAAVSAPAVPAMEDAPQRLPAVPALQEAPPRPSAMPAMPREPLWQPPPGGQLAVQTAPPLINQSTATDDAPPIEDDEGPSDYSEPDAPVSPPLPPPTITPAMAGDPDLAEAKKYAVELLQGKVLD